MTPLKLTEAEGFGPSVGITFPDGIGKKDQDDILTFPAFTEWKTTLRTNLELQQKEDHVFHSDPYTLRSVNIQSYDRFNNAQNSMGFVKLDATIERTTEGPGHRLPGVSFLRGGSVAKLMILRPNDNINERYVVMTYQPRVPAGSLQFLEIPAGMLDGENNFRLKAAKEIKEETNFEVKWEDLIDLTNLALKDSEIRDKGLKNAMYPSPGGSDEFISIMLWEKEIDRQSIEDMKERLTGERTQEELITLRFCVYEELWKEGARDAKTLAAWALYEGLSRSGKLREAFAKRKAA